MQTTAPTIPELESNTYLLDGYLHKNYQSYSLLLSVTETPVQVRVYSVVAGHQSDILTAIISPDSLIIQIVEQTFELQELLIKFQSNEK